MTSIIQENYWTINITWHDDSAVFVGTETELEKCLEDLKRSSQIAGTRNDHVVLAESIFIQKKFNVQCMIFK